MPIKGVSIQEEEIIFLILKPFSEKYDFYYYGSRVKGNFRPLSDLDILVFPFEKIDMEDIEKIKSAFDESNLPYVVNLSYNVEDSFYKLIEKDLVKIERKKDDA